MNKLLLDAREMEHPEPLQIGMKHLKVMSSKDYFYMLSNKNPIPLLDLATEKGFFHLSHQDEKELWHIIITKNQTVTLKELLDV